jgi:hypothetical protein
MLRLPLRTLSAATAPLAVAALLLFYLAGCSTPELDAHGAIECGGDDGQLCPPGFECRWGRCCPEGSPLEQCPTTLAPDRRGLSYAPNDGGLCPAGYQKVGSKCCLPQTPDCNNTKVGTTCSASAVDTQCAMGSGGVPLCVRDTDTSFPGDEFPGGYCSVTCNPDVPQASSGCGDFGVCVHEGSIGACVAECTLEHPGQMRPCRRPESGPSPYVCIPLYPNVLDPQDPHSTEGLCIPDCTVDPGFCGSNGTCNRTTRQCEVHCAAPNASCPVGYDCDPADHVCKLRH